MKKGLQIVLVAILFVQQFMMMPFSVIAEDWSADEGINFKSVKLVDENGETVEVVTNDSQVTLELEWETTQAGERERTLYLPETLTAHPGTQKLKNDNGDEAGVYILTEKQLMLKTQKSETTQSGKVRLSARLNTKEAGQQTLVFNSKSDEWNLNVNVTQTVNKEMENKTEEKSNKAEDKVDANEKVDDEKNNAQENDSEKPEEKSESVDSEEANADTNKKEDSEEKIKDESNDEADLQLDKEEATEEPAESKNTNNTEKSDAVKADKKESVSTLAEVGDQLKFSNVLFTDDNGTEFSAGNPYDLDVSPIGRLSLDWFLTQGHTATGGDTYSFQLPNAFKPVSGTSGKLGDVGTWTVNAAGEITFLFNEAVDGDEVNGSFWFEVSLDEEALSDEIEQEVKFDVDPETTVNFPVTPKNSSLIDKKGTINSEGFNSTEAYWTVDINTSLKKMVDPVVSDDLPINMTYKKDSLVITTLKMTPQGQRIEKDVLSPEFYSVSMNNGKLVVDLNGLDEEQLKQAYRLDYATEIVEPDKGFDGSQRFKNKAVLSSGGSTYDARSTVSSGYGKAIEKLDPGYNSKEQSFNWTINYNYNEKRIDKGSAQLKDSWTPKGQMALDENSLKVYPVTIDENGKSTVATDPIDSSLYDLTVNPDDSGFDLQFNEAIDRQAYQIRYTTNVLGDKGNNIVESNGSVSNKVNTGTEHSDGSSGKWGQQGIIKKHINTDVGNKQIDWQMKINQNSYLMENLKLTDVFKDDGLTLMEDESNYS
ncbi:collagen binding domain-containing protein, partial [Alkalibacterium kapii]|uniref:collagen binding domain-containing protein n=1 Tax=Alkalibacterium kapii TaxID=426704 RepID=UPI0011BE2C87